MKQNCMYGEINSRLSSGNARKFGPESFVSCLLSRNIKIKIQATILLHVVLYGFESWSAPLRRIFGPKRGVIRDLRKLYNAECHDLHCSSNMGHASGRKKCIQNFGGET